MPKARQRTSRPTARPHPEPKWPVNHAGRPLDEDELLADAELIRLCNRLVDIEHKQASILATWRTPEDERRTAPAVDLLYKERAGLFGHIAIIGAPTTMAGARALAAVALAGADKDQDGELMAAGDYDRLTLTLLEFLTGEVRHVG